MITIIPCKYILVCENIIGDDENISIKQFIVAKHDSEVQVGDLVFDYGASTMVKVISVDMKKRTLACQDGEVKFILLLDSCGKLMAIDEQIGWIVNVAEDKYVPIDENHIKQILDDGGKCFIEVVEKPAKGRPPRGYDFKKNEKFKAKIIEGKIALRIREKYDTGVEERLMLNLSVE